MNKLIKISLFGLVFLGVLSVPAFSDNAVKMVTYFPVPYAAYNNVFVSKKFDVGTTTGTFTLNLGNNACNNTTLKAAKVNLLNITDNSTLSFANDIYTENALFGDKNATGPVNMKFKDLRINTLNNNSTDAVKDVSATDWTVHGNMYMAENSFVTTNDAAKLPQCENTVRWKQLKIGGKQGYYLVCGGGGETECKWTPEGGEEVYCVGLDQFPDCRDRAPLLECQGQAAVLSKDDCGDPSENSVCYTECLDGCSCRKYTSTCYTQPSQPSTYCQWVVRAGNYRCRPVQTNYCSVDRDTKIRYLGLSCGGMKTDRNECNLQEGSTCNVLTDATANLGCLNDNPYFQPQEVSYEIYDWTCIPLQ